MVKWVNLSSRPRAPRVRAGTWRIRRLYSPNGRAGEKAELARVPHVYVEKDGSEALRREGVRPRRGKHTRGCPATKFAVGFIAGKVLVAEPVQSFIDRGSPPKKPGPRSR